MTAAKEKPPAHVISLLVENVKRVEAVFIEPGKTGVVEITGENGNGKTSVLDALWWAIAGKTAVQDGPIRDGADKARIQVDLGFLKVTRTFGRKEGGAYTTALRVETEDGATLDKGQNVLNTLIGALSFDPLEFTRQKPAEQFATMKGLLPDIDFEKIEGLNRTDELARTERNREAKAARARADGFKLPKDCPTERIDDTALVDELQRAAGHNAAIDRQLAERQATKASIPASLQFAQQKLIQATELRRQADELDAEAVKITADVEALQKRLAEMPALPEPIDITAVRAQLDNAKDHNALVDRYVQWQDQISDAEIAEKASEELTAKIAKRNADMKATIAAADMPIAGLGFGDGIVTLNDQPFDQASRAQQIRASVAIAAAMNPRLRVIRIYDGSLLDDTSWALLVKMAEEMNLQIWAETVSSARAGAIVIEDGHVRGQNLQAAE